MAVAQPQPHPSIVSALISGAMIGFVVVFAIVCSVLLLAGTTPLTAVGFAFFVAGFGGLGFGTMFGANWYVYRSGDPR
ncbi:MAG: hypothetical protein LC792_28480 [Actinobacteria bacterium]|nr:hypothetical protein [Actinomycetota bacterium]